MPSKDPIRRFEDILDNIDRIRQYTADITADEFYAERMRQDAVEPCFQRISEAAIKLGPQADEYASGQPWADIRGLGNRLRHEYDQVNVELMWRMVQKYLTPLADAVDGALKRLSMDDTGNP